MKPIAAVVAVVLLGTDAAGATARSSGAYLRIQSPARAVAMGEAVVAIADDLGALRFNPAGLAFLSDRSIAHLMHAQWYGRMQDEDLSLDWPLSRNLVLAAQYTTFHGDQTGRDRTGVATRDFTISEASYVVAAGGTTRVPRLNVPIRVGVLARYEEDRLWKKPGTMAALDVGLQGPIAGGWDFGACVQNLGPPLSTVYARAAQPVLVRVGAGKVADMDEGAWRRAAIAAEADWQIVDRRLALAAGFEAAFQLWDLTAAARGGWRLGAVGSLGGRGLPTVGVGLHFPILDSWIEVDYALVLHPHLGPAHRYSLTVLLRKVRHAEPPEPTPSPAAAPTAPGGTPAPVRSRTPEGGPAPRPPEGVVAYATDDGTAVRWNASPGDSVAYHVYVRSPGEPAWKRATARPILSTRTEIAGLRVPAGGEIAVSAVSAGGDGDESRPASGGEVLSLPEGLSLEAGPSGSLLFRMAETVLFDTGRSALKAESERVLAVVRTVHSRFPGATLRVEGHTDDQPIRGQLATVFPDNRALSEARAFAVKEALVRGGVPRTALVAEGFGESRPVASNEDEAGRALNRRVDVWLVP